MQTGLAIKPGPRRGTHSVRADLTPLTRSAARPAPGGYPPGAPVGARPATGLLMDRCSWRASSTMPV